MKRWIGALAFVGVSATASTAMGQEIQIRGPLAGAPSCRRCVQYRAGRLSLAPSYGITLQDEFIRTMFFGATVNYHVNDILAIGLYGAYGAVQIPTALTEQIQRRLTAPEVVDEQQRMNPDLPRSNATPNIPRGEFFQDQLGRLNWFVSPQVTLIPLRGKLALFQNIFVDTDFYIFAGPAFVGVSERADFDANPNNDRPPLTGNEDDIRRNQRDRLSRVAITGTFGVGLNFYINRFVSVAAEYRAFPFAWNTMGTDENTIANTCGADSQQSCQGFPDYAVERHVNGGGGRFVIDANDRSFRWNQMVNFTLNFFLPTQPRIGE